MSEKKFSIKYLNQTMKKETLNMIKTLEERINTGKDEINNIRKRIHRKKREINKVNYFQQDRRNLKKI